MTRDSASDIFDRYGVAVGVFVAAVLVRWGLHPWLGAHVPFLQFFAAILIAAWYGGLGPGLLTTGLSAFTAIYFFLPPDGFAVSETGDLVSLAMFIVTGVAISVLNERLRAARSAEAQIAAVATARAERLETIINTTVDGIIVIDELGIVEAFNRGAERIFGYTGAEVVGQNVKMLMPSPDRDSHDEYLRRFRATGEAHVIGHGRRVSGRRKDGSAFPLQLSVGEMRIGGVRKFTGMLHDLSERARLEDQVRDQAALVRVGEMAAVLAHEIKNPLAGIRGVLEVMREYVPADNPDRSMVVEAIARIDSLDMLMKDLLLFARPPRPQCSETEIAPLVALTAHLIRRDRALEALQIEVEGSAPPIMADGELLKIVFQNLLINGAHAMQGRGTIQVSVSAAGQDCEIVVRDHGPGIPADIRDRIFTPFFTTKTRGTGLGLPTAKRLVEAHQGQISIDCPSDGGTAVKIRLPFAMSATSS